MVGNSADSIQSCHSCRRRFFRHYHRFRWRPDARAGCGFWPSIHRDDPLWAPRQSLLHARMDHGTSLELGRYCANRENAPESLPRRPNILGDSDSPTHDSPPADLDRSTGTMTIFEIALWPICYNCTLVTPSPPKCNHLLTAFPYHRTVDKYHHQQEE